MATLLRADLRLIGQKESVAARVLFDTGASDSFVRRALAERIAALVPLPSPMRFTLGDGRPLNITDTVVLALQIGDQVITDHFMVFPGDSVEEVVLGASTMRKFGLKLDLEHSTVYAEIKEEPSAFSNQKSAKAGKETP